MEIQGRQDKYEIINYLKGFSIITIVLMHLLQFYPIPPFLQKISSLGGTGVHIFFFCSGFGLCFSQLKKEMTYLEFIKKRFLKIYLPYITIVIIAFFIPFTFDGSFKERLIALASHVFLFKMFVPALEGSFSYPLWYMSTLFQFYFVFIGLFKLKTKIGRKKYLIACMFISVLWWLFSSFMGISEERIWGSFFLQYLWEFALGMCIAEKLFNGEKIALRISWMTVVTIFGLAIGGILGIKGGVGKAFNDCFLAVGYGAFAIIIYIFVNIYKKICIIVNSFSYELYLVHSTVFLVIYQLLKDNLPYTVLMIISLVLCFSMAWIFHKVIGKVTKKC